MSNQQGNVQFKAEYDVKDPMIKAEEAQPAADQDLLNRLRLEEDALRAPYEGLEWRPLAQQGGQGSSSNPSISGEEAASMERREADTIIEGYNSRELEWRPL